MPLRFPDGRPFATGAARYLFRPLTETETAPRILLTVSIANFETYAFVDTGGVYLLCGPDVGAALGLSPNEGVPTTPITWRKERLEGRLHRVPLTIRAETGESLTKEVIAFVPQLKLDQIWDDDLPCVLGLQGCLEFLRFAIDPNDDTFYFGDLAESFG